MILYLCHKALLKTQSLIFILFITIACSTAIGNSALPVQTIVSGKITLLNAKTGVPVNVAVWLEPLNNQPRQNFPKPQDLKIRQQNKQFLPRVLLASVGQKVEFPNDDPFPHNLFSNSETKRFDLGLYQAGETKSVLFNRTGLVSLFCNIHPQMSAFILIVPTNFYSLSNEKGEVSIKGVPPGDYRLKVWHERAKSETLEALSRQITVGSSGASLGTIQIDEKGYSFSQHKNKDGRDYLQ
jgi:plastocyanin